jgi:SnoaL-like domain
MSSTDDDIAALRAQVRVLSDRAEITRLCDSYVMHLDKDRGNNSWFDSVFTDDVRLTFSWGEFEGMAGLAEFHQMARATFEVSHHIGSNYSIELDGDRAQVRAHMTAVHVRRGEEPGTHFGIGGHYEAEVVRTADGWRIRRFTFDQVWNAGQGPKVEAGA